ncbi:MAG: hypothetical protein IK064_01130 [Clostridia bacterium]|nr:hypothetical protein [Clostridia bacterium]
MTEPEFNEAYGIRVYNPGIEGEYSDGFYFYFDLELNDVDTSQPLTARLEYAGIGSDDWVECPSIGDSVINVTYSGSGETNWSCEDLVFDIYTLDLGDDIGMMKQARIAIDYTLGDGVTGSVYSTDISSMFIYKGEFIHEQSGAYGNGTVTGSFRIDTDLVLDLSKLELIQLTLTRYRPGEYYNMLDISGDAVISSFAGDGSFTVTYTLTGDPLDPDDENILTVAYRYSDYDGVIEWESAAFLDLEVPAVFVPPTLNSAEVEQSDEGYSYIPFNVTVGDGTKYGALTATLQHWNGSGYETFAEGSGPDAVVSLSLSQNDGTSEWIVGSSSEDCLIADLSADNGFGFFRVEISYVDDSGGTGYIYSDPMVVYKGTYVYPNEEGNMFVGDGFFYASYRIDTDLVDLSKVETVEFTAIAPDGTDILIDLEWLELDSETGEISVRGEVDCYGPVEYEYFTATVKLLYTDTAAGPVTVEWYGISGIDIELEVYYDEYPPEVLDVNVEVITSGDPHVWVSFDLIMNDAEEVTARLYYSEDINGDSFSECGSDMGTVELTHNNLSDYIYIWSTVPSDDCLSVYLTFPDGLPGFFCWFYIEFECLMPDGSVYYIYSDTVPAFDGSFFGMLSNYTMAYFNPVTKELSCTWTVFRELAPDPSKVSAVSVRLVPDTDGVAAIELPADCVTIYEGDDGEPYDAVIFAADLVLSGEAEWSVELTLTYTADEYTWTASKTVSIAWITKKMIKHGHYPKTPIKGPAGGLYYEKDKQGQDLHWDRYRGDPGVGARKPEMASPFGKTEKRRQRNGEGESSRPRRFTRHDRAADHAGACAGHRLAELSDT